MRIRPLLGLLAVALTCAFVAPAVEPATSVDVAFGESANAHGVRTPSVRRPVVPPLPLLPPPAPAVIGCALLLLGAFLVALLSRRVDDVGHAWRALLEGAPPVSA